MQQCEWVTGVGLTYHRKDKSPEMPIDGQVNHLLDWIEVGIVQVSQKPQDARSQYLPQTSEEIGT